MENRKASSRNSRNGAPRGRGLRREWAIGLFCLLMATALPALFALLGGASSPKEAEPLTENSAIRLHRHGGGEEQVTLSDLLALSLAATNPADTPAAALEAQAILLRSRAIWWLGYCEGDEDAAEADDGAEKASSAAESEDAAVEGRGLVLCDSPAHGLPYRSAGELAQLYGSREAAARLAAGEAAVKATEGQVLCYEGEIVPALLHHSSPGRTRATEKLAWLSAVSSPEEESAQEVILPAEKVRLILAATFGISLGEVPADWEITTCADEVGWVESVTVEETVLTGNAFAEALSLPSACFTLTVEADGIAFTTVGEGSGCGLSRAGAAIYAEGGLTRAEILAHYYPNCTIGAVNYASVG